MFDICIGWFGLVVCRGEVSKVAQGTDAFIIGVSAAWDGLEHSALGLSYYRTLGNVIAL